jgi:hypothetical protein
LYCCIVYCCLLVKYEVRKETRRNRREEEGSMVDEVTDTEFINREMGENFTVLNYPIPCPLVLLRGCFGDMAQSWAVKEAV